MINVALILILPFFIAFAALIFFKGSVTIGEFSLQILAPLVVAGILVACFTYSKTADTEIYNSQITSRDRTQVSCSHSYQCHCRLVSSSSGKTTTFHEECDTCYEHPYDVDWTVSTSSGESVRINREDRQGLVMPERWKRAYVGEPFSSRHTYANYLLLNKSSVLFGGQGDVEHFKALIPTRPNVYDYYHLDHVLVTGGGPVDTKTWNWLLNEANKTLGPKQQINILVVIAKTSDRAYTEALKTAWLGGKKNEVIVVIGSEDGHKIDFADILSWTPREDFKVELRDRIEQIGTLDQRDAIVHAIIDEVSSKYERMHMKQYKYMLANADISNGERLTAVLLCLLLEIGITWWAVTNDRNMDDPDDPFHRDNNSDRDGNDRRSSGQPARPEPDHRRNRYIRY